LRPDSKGEIRPVLNIFDKGQLMKPFKINSEFTVIPDKNLVRSEVKLEPRLMKLLCLLAANNEKLVTREEIIEKIWNGYGGGEEGLTQAVSFLRKILKDTGKTIIETVPKSGYIFHGNVEMPETFQPASAHSPIAEPRAKIKLGPAAIISLVWIIIFAVIFYTYTNMYHKTPSPNVKVPPESVSKEKTPAPQAK
jgi:DNA-binding winged helix-turn-helix (wHTH) protein